MGNTAARKRLGMPEQLGSCHTALVGGYAIEGHVPAREVKRLLAERPRALPAPRGAVRFDAVSFGYKEKVVLPGLDLHVPAGQTVALVGATQAQLLDDDELGRPLAQPGRSEAPAPELTHDRVAAGDGSWLGHHESRGTSSISQRSNTAGMIL